jgi:single-strand DNA-binding protein
MNRVELVGNLGADVETRYTSAGILVANFRVATTERWEKNGEPQSSTEWHRIVAWNKTAEYCAKNFKKGSFVKLTGSNKTRSWEKDGRTVYVTEVKVYKAELMGK